MKKLLMLVLIFSCTKKQETVGRLEMFNRAKAVDDSIELVLDESLRAALTSNHCKNYGKGCLAIARIKVKELEIIFVEFPSIELARREAMRIDQYYYKNWVIDDVKGEPPLERFVKEAFNAVRPLAKNN